MNNEIRSRKIFNFSLAVVIFLSFLIGFQVSGILRMLDKSNMPPWASNVLSSITQDLYAAPGNFSEKDLGVLYQTLNFISKYYLHRDEITNDQVIHGAAAGAVNSLGDRYSRFIPPVDQKNLMEEIEGEYAGVGISIIDRPNLLPPHALQVEIDAGADPESPTFYKETRGTLVVQAFENGPAFDAGIKANDVVAFVDGQSLRGKTAEDAVLLIKGPENTEVEITVWRPSTAEELTFTVTRRIVHVPTVGKVEMLAGNVGYIQLNNFNNLTPAEVHEAVEKLQSQGMKGLIFDLRNNTGGPMPAAAGVADIFISDGPMVYYEESGGKKDIFESADGGFALNIPLVLLVNGNTASASEIVAGAVRDTGVGILVGETTFGKGVVQSVNTLSDGSGLVITTGRYLTPNQHEITQDGLPPDITVNLDPERIRNIDPEIDDFITRMDALNEQYAKLREEMMNYLTDHDLQREEALRIIQGWIDTGSRPESELKEE